MTENNVQPIDWQSLNTPKKLKGRLNSWSDEEKALELLQEAYDIRVPGLFRWIAAAFLGDHCAYGFPEDFLQLKWEDEKLRNETDYYSEFAEKVFSEVRKSFHDAAGLQVLTEGRLAAGSEDAYIEIDKDGYLELISDY